VPTSTARAEESKHSPVIHNTGHVLAVRARLPLPSARTCSDESNVLWIPCAPALALGQGCKRPPHAACGEGGPLQLLVPLQLLLPLSLKDQGGQGGACDRLVVKGLTCEPEGDNGLPDKEDGMG
jgi:hypothetical protein